MLSSLNILSSILALAFLVGDSSAASSCKVLPTGGDDHDAIVSALEQCADGGTVHFPAGNTYILGSPITAKQYPALSGTQIVIQGELCRFFEPRI
jgi:hypothetical protein